MALVPLGNMKNMKKLNHLRSEPQTDTFCRGARSADPKPQARRKFLRINPQQPPAQSPPVGRGILICLGWLRLFQTIVAKDYKGVRGDLF